MYGRGWPVVYVRVRKTGIIMRRGRGGEGIGEGRRESCEAPPAQGAEEGEMGLGPGPLWPVLCLLGLVSGSQAWGASLLSELTCLNVTLICVGMLGVYNSHKLVMFWTIWKLYKIRKAGTSHFSHKQSIELKIRNYSQFPLVANFLILGAAAGGRKTQRNGAVKSDHCCSTLGIALFTHFSQIVQFSHLVWHTAIVAATNVFIKCHSSCLPAAGGSTRLGFYKKLKLSKGVFRHLSCY